MEIEENLSVEQRAKEAVQLYAGSPYLRTVLKNLKVDYVKVDKGLKVKYVLRHKSFGKTFVTL